MNSGRHILIQILDLVDRKTLSRLVERYDAESRVRHFGCRQQLICMVFAQLTWREGLRDIATCLDARPSALHHLGFTQPVAKSTLASEHRAASEGARLILTTHNVLKEIRYPPGMHQGIYQCYLFQLTPS